MSNERKRLFVLILLTILTGLTGLFGNIAANQLPQSWQPHLWLAWVLFVLFLLLTVMGLIWQIHLEKEESTKDLGQKVTDSIPGTISPAEVLAAHDDPLQFDVFISYSHADKEAVTKLTNRLRSDDFTLWIDEEQIGGGDPLRQTMVDGIKQSQHVICCLSATYLTSRWGTFESAVNQALDPDNRDRRLIPVQVASVDIPPDYKWLYCPDLTNPQTWEREYQKTIKYLRSTQKPETPTSHIEVDNNNNGMKDEESNESNYSVASDTDLQSVGQIDFISASPSPRLQALGFRYDPFAYPEAERMPAAMVEATFVTHPGFDEDVMDLNRSTALLAQPGSGKTAGLRQLETFLLDKRRRSFSGTIDADEPPPFRPLVVTYNTFGKVMEQLPNISLQDHAGPLLSAIAEAAWEFIASYPEQFLALEREMQSWWGDFVATYLYGRPPIHQIHDKRLADVWRNITANAQKRELDTPLEHILQELLHTRGPLLALQLDSLFVLTDGIDGYQKQSLDDLAAFVAPLLTPKLLSLSGIFWKYFLPSILENHVYQSPGRQTGRLTIVSIEWDSDESSLVNFLQARLKWASDNLIIEMANLCERDLVRAVNVEKELVEMALRHYLGPPRAVLELTKRLCTWQSTQTNDHLITLDEWESFSLQVEGELKQTAKASLLDGDEFVQVTEDLCRNLEQRMGLAKKIEAFFNLEELRELSSLLNIQFENLPGDTLQRKAQELVDFLCRRNRLNDLVLALQRLRPLVQWV